MIDYKNPKLVLPNDVNSEGKVEWNSPSNIAIVKYWGKFGEQLPRNPSISFTLNSATTTTKVSWESQHNTKLDKDKGLILEFYFEGERNLSFEKRILKYFSSLREIFPFISQLKFKIESTNTFPHSSGIASSASAMSAISLCLCSIENKLFNTLNDQEAFFRKASYVARLGSGSACRSVYPKAALWGELSELPKSSNLYAISLLDEVHPVFVDFHDDILIINSKEKKVSSSVGHSLMDHNYYAKARFNQANSHVLELLEVLRLGDIEKFGALLEQEALTLHALMMTSNPPYLLFQENTLKGIELIWDFRNRTKLPLYFTLDAGPNLHLLYPSSYSIQIQDFIQNELKPLCESGHVIEDRVGDGPQKLI